MTLRLLAVLCVLAGTLALCSAPALAAHSFAGSFGPAGPGSGAFSTPQSVAVDQATGDVYVYDIESEKAFIYKFNSTGEPENFSALGENVIEGSGEAFPGVEQIAVDSSSGPAAGDIYVVEGEVVTVYGEDGERLGELNGEVEEDGGLWGEFPCGVAVDPAGNVYVGLVESGVDRYAPTENPVVNEDYTSSLMGLELPERSCDLAADSEGNVYVDSREGPVTKYEALQFGAPEASGTVIDEHGRSVAIDPAASEDELYVDEGADIAQYESSGVPLGKFGESGAGALSGASDGVAVNHASGDVYVADPEAEEGAGEVEIYRPAVLPAVSLEPISELQSTSVTLNGTVNPNGVEVSSCVLEYGTEAGVYGHSAPCEPSPGAGDDPVAVSAKLTGLQQLTLYHYRLVAGNASSPEPERGEDRTFTTYGRPTIDDESVSSVAATNATFQAQINPDGYTTGYHFQYGPTSSCGSDECSIPVPAAEIAPGTSDVAVSVYVQNLQPGTPYHYRVLATNEPAPGAPETAEGEEFAFTTQPAVAQTALPDGRQWELVSPPSKEGALIGAIREGLIQAAQDGGAISYIASAPTEAQPAGNVSTEWDQVLSEHGPEGWSSQDVTPPYDAATGLNNDQVYQFFSSTLSLGLLEPKGDTPLSPQASERTIYLRDDANGGYTPLVTAANVPPGIRFGQSEANHVEFVDATPDLSHVILTSEEPLTSNAIKNGQNKSLYEWAGGKLQLVSILPNNEPATAEGETSALGDKGLNVRDAISADGSRIFWNASGPGKETHLYMRDMATEETIQLDENQGATDPGKGKPVFQTANSEGSKVFFTDEQRLTADSTAGGGEAGTNEDADLYECEVVETAAGKPVCHLTDLTVDEHHGESAEVAVFYGLVIGASEDGSYVYFVANGVLAPGAAPGDCNSSLKSPDATCNLYVSHEDPVTHAWTTTFIAALSEKDGNGDWAASGEGVVLKDLTSRVSPNGEYLAFMSDRPLTGYDNTDINSGQADEEVFLYDARSKRLVCASCNPTGARPAGVYDNGHLLVDEPGMWGPGPSGSPPGRWLAGSIPGWTTVDTTAARYQSRYLSNEGRLFFNSPDALVPQDTNGVEDVYEYEPPGVGSCASSSVTFSERSGGCVGLISSGTSSEESAFQDASESGDDIFFLTTAQLSSQDRDTAFDVYDAHVCSATSPCVAPSPASPPACTTADSCRAASAPQPSIFGASGSATFAGAGNLVAPVALKPAVKSNSLTRKQKLALALKGCRKKESRKQRAVCERKARKRYGPAKSGKGNAKKRGDR